MSKHQAELHIQEGNKTFLIIQVTDLPEGLMFTFRGDGAPERTPVLAGDGEVLTLSYKQKTVTEIIKESLLGRNNK